jgi:hypothetical protein
VIPSMLLSCQGWVGCTNAFSNMRAPSDDGERGSCEALRPDTLSKSVSHPPRTPVECEITLLKVGQLLRARLGSRVET